VKQQQQLSSTQQQHKQKMQEMKLRRPLTFHQGMLNMHVATKIREEAEKAVAAEQQLAKLQQQQAEQHANQLQQQQLHQLYQPSDSPAREHFLFPFQCCSERMGAPLPGVQSLAPTARTVEGVPAYAPRGPRDRAAAAQPQPAGRPGALNKPPVHHKS
jgi:hypothetical protein